MRISDDLAELNHERFARWSPPFTLSNAKQSILAFRGQVYVGLNADTFDDEDFQFAQECLRIHSGLYGLLRPLDLIQPYRLEMGTKTAVADCKNLYEFWGDKITNRLNADLAKHKEKVLVNLASQEYFKSINTKALDARIINPEFKEYKDRKYKQIPVFSKHARGLMASYIIRNRLKDTEKMKGFDMEGYGFNESLSEGDRWVFTRKPQR